MLAILAAVMLAAAPPHDTVFTADGGRVVGKVIEEGPQVISIQLPDGTFRRFSRREVTRIEYADGSVSTIRPPEPPPSGPPPPYPPPGYPPPPPPRLAPTPWPGGPITPFYLSFGLAGAYPFGEIEDGVDMSRVFDPQLDIDLEGGLRLSPHLALGLYVDIGVGDPARETGDACRQAGINCDAFRTRFGPLLRFTFAPAARMTPWLTAGTGIEWGTVTADDWFDDDDDLFSYRGWEVLRLMGGIDLRSSPSLGVGFYGGVAFGRYDHVEDSTGDFDIDRERFHTTATAGLRFTLFP